LCSTRTGCIAENAVLKTGDKPMIEERKHCKKCGGAKWFILRNNITGKEIIECCECYLNRTSGLIKGD